MSLNQNTNVDELENDFTKILDMESNDLMQRAQAVGVNKQMTKMATTFMTLFLDSEFPCLNQVQVAQLALGHSFNIQLSHPNLFFVQQIGLFNSQDSIKDLLEYQILLDQMVHHFAIKNEAEEEDIADRVEAIKTNSMRLFAWLVENGCKTKANKKLVATEYDYSQGMYVLKKTPRMEHVTPSQQNRWANVKYYSAYNLRQRGHTRVYTTAQQRAAPCISHKKWMQFTGAQQDEYKRQATVLDMDQIMQLCRSGAIEERRLGSILKFAIKSL